MKPASSSWQASPLTEYLLPGPSVSPARSFIDNTNELVCQWGAETSWIRLKRKSHCSQKPRAQLLPLGSQFLAFHRSQILSFKVVCLRRRPRGLACPVHHDQHWRQRRIVTALQQLEPLLQNKGRDQSRRSGSTSPVPTFAVPKPRSPCFRAPASMSTPGTLKYLPPVPPIFSLIPLFSAS